MTTLTSIFSETQRPDEQWLARAQPEPALEPDLPIIDPHLHFWHHKSGYRYFVEEFARDVAESGHNIEGTVFIECNAMYRESGPEHLKPVGETEFAVGMAAMAASGKYTRARGAAGIVAYTDLTLDPGLLRETLDAHRDAANGRLRGIRQRAKWDADPIVAGPVRAGKRGLFLEPDFRRGLAELTKMGLLFEASIFHPQLPEVISLARAHPEANIVVIHTASPLGIGSYAGQEKEVRAQWTAGMKELASCPNVTVKMGGLLMCLGNFDFSKAEAPPTSEQLAALWRPFIEPCIEIFGPERCMVSSNFPVEKAGVTYGATWNMFKRIAAGYSPDEKRMLFAGTARRVYGLD
ncbi:MAG TPA: amidohydrolase family protein [Ramlibacter sp.]|nr:amidohydrolase family protein [Ramlibacter sp.]